MLGKTTQQSSPARNLPTQFHVGDPGGRDDHIKRALAHHLVGDHDIPTARITCLGHAHVNESGSPNAGRARKGLPGGVPRSRRYK